MSSYIKVQNWLKEKMELPIPLLDDTGLSRITVDNLYLLHILAVPEPAFENQESLFLYVPLVNTVDVNNHCIEELFWHVGAQNMPGILPAGFRLAASKKHHFFWLCGCFSTENMNARQFEEIISTCIRAAREHRPLLIDIIRGTGNNADKMNENNALLTDATAMPQNIIWG